MIEQGPQEALIHSQISTRRRIEQLLGRYSRVLFRIEDEIARGRAILPYHHNSDFRGDVFMQPHRDFELAQLLDRLFQSGSCGGRWCNPSSPARRPCPWTVTEPNN